VEVDRGEHQRSAGEDWEEVMDWLVKTSDRRCRPLK